MTDLIARLEAATEGNDFLDLAIMIQINRADARNNIKAPHYTTSIDAALTLVPEGRRWEIQQDLTAAFASVDGEGTGRCPTPAMALTIAALKARAT